MRHSARQNRAKKRSTTQALTPAELESCIHNNLLRKRPRQVLEGLKGARALRVDVPHANVLRHCAYLLRSRELARQNMAKEAASMAALTRETAPGIDALKALPPAIFALWLRIASLPDAVAMAAALEAEAPAVQRILVDRLMLEGIDLPAAALGSFCWGTHVQAMQAARAAMVKGAWQDAAQALAEVPRQSLLSPWRWLCKTMHAFVSNDADALARCLALQPSEFALQAVLPTLRLVTSNPEPSASGTPLQRVLGGSDASQHNPDDLVASLRRGDANDLARRIASLADSTGAPAASMRQSVLELLALQVRTRPELLKTLQATVPRLLEQPLALAVQAKLAFLTMPFMEHGTAWDRITSYWRALPHEFPDPQTRRFAQAHVLHWVAQQVTNMPICWDHDGGRAVAALAPLLVHKLWEPALVPLALLEASLHADADNPQTVLLLRQLLQNTELPATLPCEELLARLSKQLPDETEPLLQLARLYQRKNAYRKAENAIALARERAPEDPRVQDEYAASLVVSACKSAARQQRARALADLMKVSALARPNVGETYEVARVVCAVLTDESNVDEALAGLHALPLWQRARIMALAGQAKLPEASHRSLRAFRARIHKSLRETCTSADVRQLVAPRPHVVKAVFTSVPMARLLIELVAQLLPRVNAVDLLDIYDSLLTTSPGCALVMKDAQQRALDHAFADIHPELRLYALVVPALSGGHIDIPRLSRLVKEASPQQREQLEKAAKRLAAFTHGGLAEALRRLDFERLPVVGDDDDLFDAADLFGANDGDGNSALMEGLFDADDAAQLKAELMGKKPLQVLRALEEVLDYGLRGAPHQVLMALGGLGPLRLILDALRPHRALVFAKASKEARLLLNNDPAYRQEPRV